VVSVRLGWSDNSNNENGFVIERCDQIVFQGEGVKKIAACSSGWTIVGRVGANVTSYVDNSALAKHTYLYRIKAVNQAGDSGYTTESVITTGAK
ncbi:MAG: fibronectin type III domain-containing protein, partial [Candidatus Binatia bacterium]